MKHKNTRINKALRYVWEYTESYLCTWPKKIFFLFCTLSAILLSAYIIAFFDVGLKHMDPTLSGMAEAYALPDERYPWGILFLFMACILFVAALIIWKNGTPPGGRNFKLSKSNVYGSGREINGKELRKVSDVTSKNSSTGTILGQLDDTGKQVIAAKANAMPNNNILVFGPPGSGKSTSFVKPYITQAILRRESVIASDTKGEVYAETIELARRHGYLVLRLDLKDPAHSDGWHVLKELRNDDIRALIFAQTVMANTGNQKDTFAAPQESLLKACCLYQERCPDLPDSQRTFYHAFSLLLQGAEALDATITGAFATYGECMQVVSESYATFLQGSANLRGNIITGLANRLQVLASPPVREMTSTDEIDFASIGKEPTILYISLSDQHQTMSFLASLAFSFAFLDLVELADSNPAQKLDVPVHFMMEEFGNIGKVPSIDKYLSTARSRGISINLVVQSLAQLVGIYEESMTDTILADCATWMALACNDKSTANLLEWRSGEATVQVTTVQHDAMEPSFRLSHRHSSGDGRRNFYTSNDIMKIRAREECFIVWQQLDSLKCRAFPIFQHQEFLAGHMPAVSSKSLIPLRNVAAKKQFREWEEERIHAFRAWMEAGGDPLKDYNIPGRKKPTGEAAGEELPDIINIHTLERMAIAKAAGKKYEPKADPDHPLYDPRYDPDSNQYDSELARKEAGTEPEPGSLKKPTMVAEETLWDLSGVVFETVAEAEDAEPTPGTPPPTDTPTQAEVPAPDDARDTAAEQKSEPKPEAAPAKQKKGAQKKQQNADSQNFELVDLLDMQFKGLREKDPSETATTVLAGKHKQLPPPKETGRNP